MHSLNSSAGILAIAGTAVGAVALILGLVLALGLRRLRAQQRVILGDGTRDLVGHSASLDAEFGSLTRYVQDSAHQLQERMTRAEERLDHAVAFRSLIRYDAYGEMSGRQSTSIALLDATRSGVVLSSIHHRDQARLYAKQIHQGEAELQLSPEEEAAVRIALEGGQAA